MNKLLVLCVLTFINYCYVKSDVQSIKTNKVEFKTEAPDNVLSDGAPKDCNEYLHGQLKHVRAHGSRWQHGVSDCSNCTCDNGDIRCFFYFCKGPPTGFMTPPSTDKDSQTNADNSTIDLDSLLLEEELTSSGDFSPDAIPPEYNQSWDDEDEVERLNLKHKNFIQLHQQETSVVEGNKIEDIPNHPSYSNSLGFWPSQWHKDSTPSPQVQTSSEKYSPSTWVEEAKMSHPKDRKIDRSENETHDISSSTSAFCGKICDKVCLQGYKIDHITGCKKCNCSACKKTPPCPPKKCLWGRVYDGEGCPTCACATYESQNTDEDITFSKELEEFEVTTPLNTPLEQESDSPVKITTTYQEEQKSSEEKEPCNSTEDKSSKMLSSEPLLPQLHRQKSDLNGESFVLDDEDKTTVKSLAKDDQSYLLVILIPMGLICSFGFLILIHIYRRYHSDKYDINAYKPEEKQKLRPVKCLHDDQSSLKHVSV